MAGAPARVVVVDDHAHVAALALRACAPARVVLMVFNGGDSL